MMVSPKAAQAAGDKFGANPVCSGPFKFVERVAQDRIVLERFPNYWNKGDDPFRQASSTCRSSIRRCGSPTCKSGQLDFIERMAASDVPAAKTDARFKISKITEIGYQGITINVGKSDLAQKNPLGKDPRVREAFELALDRDGIVQVAMDGEADAGNQWVAPTNPFYAKNVPIPKRDVAQGQGAAAGGGRAEPDLHADDADDGRRAEDRAGRAGDGEGGGLRREDPVDRVRDLARSRRQGPVRRLRARRGAAAPIPTATSSASIACKQPLNYAGYCKPGSRRPARTRRAPPATRRSARSLTTQIAAIVLKDRPIIYLYHRHWLWAYTNKLSGLRTVPDGLVRVQGL